MDVGLHADSTVNVIEIDLGNGYVALVDECDAAIAEMPWKLHRGGGGHLYASIQLRQQGKRACVLLHRFLMQPEQGQVVDHINSNGLDNRRSNLRVCSQSENLRNRPGWRNATVPFKGVRRNGKRFRASIMCKGIRYELGVFDSAELAAQAYAEAAARLHGDFANVGHVVHDKNFPSISTVNTSQRHAT